MNMKEDIEHEQLAFTMSDADDKTWRHECQSEVYRDLIFRMEVHLDCSHLDQSR
jgi:hypothetical protein